MENREGNVWIGTPRGAERVRESRLTPVEFPRATNGFALTTDDAGAMLVGIDSNNGLFEITGGSDAKVVPGPRNTTCAYRADDDVVWLGGRYGIRVRKQSRGGKRGIRTWLAGTRSSRD